LVASPAPGPKAASIGITSSCLLISSIQVELKDPHQLISNIFVTY
jgi:hypothetical protein